MKLLALLAVIAALGFAGYRTFLSEAPKPETVAAAEASPDAAQITGAPATTPRNGYQCAYTPSSQAEPSSNDVYGVNVPSQAEPTLETDLAGIAKINLTYNEGNYLIAQIFTSPAAADDAQGAKLLGEGQFSMKDGLDLAAIKDGVKIGTLTCNYTN